MSYEYLCLMLVRHTTVRNPYYGHDGMLHFKTADFIYKIEPGKHVDFLWTMKPQKGVPPRIICVDTIAKGGWRSVLEIVQRNSATEQEEA